MSTTAVRQETRSRWLDWAPKPTVFSKSAESEPTEPTKPGSVGFVGAPSAKSPEIRPEPDASALARPSKPEFPDGAPQATIFSDPAGDEPTRPSKPGSVGFVGAASAKFPEIRPEPVAAIFARASAVLSEAGVRLMQLDGVTTIGIWSDLDGPKVRAALAAFGSDQLPIRYLDGAGVPMRYKLRRVEGDPVPMSVLKEMELGPADPWKIRDQMLPKSVDWAEWKAAQLNRFFREQGVTGHPGRITAETVRHGGGCAVTRSTPTPFDISTWGGECARGVRYADTGVPVRSGTRGVVRKITKGRKHRGSVADDLARSEERRAMALLTAEEA